MTNNAFYLFKDVRVCATSTNYELASQLPSLKTLAINDSVYLIAEGIPLRMKNSFRIILTIAWHKRNFYRTRDYEPNFFPRERERLRCRCDKFSNSRKRYGKRTCLLI